MLPQAEQYLRGLVQAERKNMERMVEAVPDTTPTNRYSTS
jgi:hypothetical protein